MPPDLFSTITAALPKLRRPVSTAAYFSTFGAVPNSARLRTHPQKVASPRFFAGSAPKWTKNSSLPAKVKSETAIERPNGWQPSWKKKYEAFKQSGDPAELLRRRRKLYITLGTGTALFGGYYVAHLEVVPISGHRRFVDVTPSQEKKIADAAYREVMEEYGNRLLPPEHSYSRLVRKVAQRLIKVSGMSDVDWEIHVVNLQQRNAFVLPGGKIFVFSGIIPICQDEEGLAAVLVLSNNPTYEMLRKIGHQIARHSAEKLSFLKITLLTQLILSFFVDTSIVTNRVFMNLGILLPFDRKCEVEADEACYNPAVAIKMWEHMSATEKREPLRYLSTHPGTKQRIGNIQKWLPRAIQRRAESNCSEELFSTFSEMSRQLPLDRLFKAPGFR